MTADGSAGGTISLTKAMREALRAELRRTGVTAIMLLNGASDMPNGLDARAVNRWMNGLVKTAPEAHVAYVAARWAALPGGGEGKRGKRYPTASGAWIEVTEAMAAELRAELARTGVDHATLLDGLDDVPNGLTARIVAGWLYRHAATTSAAHWMFVIGHLRALPNRTEPLPTLRRSGQHKGSTENP